MSKKLTLSNDGATAAVADATAGDIFSSLFDSDVALTGTYKYFQIAGLVAGGMLYANKRHSDSFMNFGGHKEKNLGGYNGYPA